MPIYSDYPGVIASVKIESEDLEFVYQLAQKCNMAPTEVCCYVYLLLLVQYTGNLLYQVITTTGSSYTFGFMKSKSIKENLDRFSKKHKQHGEAELCLQECESLQNEYMYWIEIKDNSMVIRMNLKTIVSIVPPYVKQHFMYCLKSAGQENLFLCEMNPMPENEKKVLEKFQGKDGTMALECIENSISGQFARVVKERSANYAVEEQGNILTYFELDQYSDRAAAALQSLGIVRNSVVGVMMNADIDLIVWVLGIIKLQAVYMPIDTENPFSSVEYMARESHARYIVGGNKKTIEGLPNVHFVDKHLYKKYATDKLIKKKEEKMSDWAYIIYTSGSTGRPKGIAVSHSNLLHQIYALKEWGGFPQYATSLLSAHFCFDVSLQQIFFPLLTGGTVCILPQEMKMNSRRVIRYINERNMDIVNFVPSYLEVLLETTNEIMKCKVLLIGGELFNNQLFSMIGQRVEAEKVCNIYGPSEATINTTIHICNREKQYETIPIGKPLKFYHTYVVNRLDKQVPIGVKGELYISGPGVAQGYIQESEMTRTKFVHISSLDSWRIYKSGDLVSWNTEGELCFFGRKDLQVKIRGKRFEVGEIESVMLRYNKITSVVVIIVEEKFPKLIAYYTAKEDIKKSELKEYLESYLLPHMIPLEFIRLDYIPLTDRGKADRNYLKNKWKKEGNGNVKNHKG